MQRACRHRCRVVLPAVIAAAAAGMPCLAIAEDVTIYRCTDAQGRLSLRDTPCAAGEKQQVQTMQRPVDPPPRPQPAPPAPPPPAATPPVVQTVVLQPPRPMYECVTPDGETYTSETPEGNPRWVPLWTLGYPVVVPHRRHGGGFRADVGVHDGRIDGRVTIDHSIGGGHRPPIAVGYPAGTWIRDACHPLPQQEICDRLRDRRSELGRRYNSALQSERQRITRERRGIDARLANDCRNH